MIVDPTVEIREPKAKAPNTPYRFPLASLLEATGLTRREMSRRLHKSWTQLQALETSGLDAWQADEFAVTLGTHPMAVWGWDWCDDALPEYMKLQNRLAGWAEESGERWEETA